MSTPSEPRVVIHRNSINGIGAGVGEYVQILKNHNIEFVVTEYGEPGFWDYLRTCEVFVFKTALDDHFMQLSADIVPVVEKNFRCSCIPSAFSRYLYDDKARQYHLLSSAGFPACPTWVFYNPGAAKSFYDNAQYPLVIKLKGGASGKNVQLVNSCKEAKRICKLLFNSGVKGSGLPGSLWREFNESNPLAFIRKQMGRTRQRLSSELGHMTDHWNIDKNYVLFQEFQPGNDYDTRVVVIGEKAFAFRRINRTDDFRASGSGQVCHDEQQIDLGSIRLALDVSNHFGFGVMAYDIVYDANRNPVIIEMSYHYGSDAGSAARECPGYWDAQLKWHKSTVNPRLMELEHLLGQRLEM